uniref:ATP synthase subunit a n=1 Tax=Acraea vestalis TaxID=1156543 RepID=A0A140CVJ5_9NEOP|nr:ATP synthase F0 subunit 6 [Acraea vestalis]AMJ17319.1 ATP synthase F0 subunit 6 [Acraea vestalis]
MMNNLFSMFDPSTNLMNMPLNWLSSILGIFFLPMTFWFIPNRHFMLWNYFTKKIKLEFKILLNHNKKNISPILLFISLFYFICFNNFLGLFPYIFTSTSHIIVSLSISLTLWLSYMIFGWINNTNHMFTHMIPQGTPTILMPFMVLIETISNIIRPLTLAIRLMANMIAGHLILNLLSSNGINLSNYFILFLIIIQIMLFCLESAVAIIQAYVISVLNLLYYNESN